MRWPMCVQSTSESISAQTGNMFYIYLLRIWRPHARVAGCESHIGEVGNPEGSAAALAFIFPLAIR